MKRRRFVESALLAGAGAALGGGRPASSAEGPRRNWIIPTDTPDRFHLDRDCAALVEQVVSDRINRTEVQEQGREQDECAVAQDSNRQIEIAITSRRRVKVKDECG